MLKSVIAAAETLHKKNVLKGLVFFQSRKNTEQKVFLGGSNRPSRKKSKKSPPLSVGNTMPVSNMFVF